MVLGYWVFIERSVLFQMLEGGANDRLHRLVFLHGFEPTVEEVRYVVLSGFVRPNSCSGTQQMDVVCGRTGPLREHWHPYGDGEAQRLVFGLWSDVQSAYERLLSEGDTPEGERYETKGEVPIIRDGRRRYEDLDHLTLRDLPVVLDTFVVLEEALKERKREETERKPVKRKERERIRAKERRRLTKLGEWW